MERQFDLDDTQQMTVARIDEGLYYEDLFEAVQEAYSAGASEAFTGNIVNALNVITEKFNNLGFEEKAQLVVYCNNLLNQEDVEEAERRLIFEFAEIAKLWISTPEARQVLEETYPEMVPIFYTA